MAHGPVGVHVDLVRRASTSFAGESHAETPPMAQGARPPLRELKQKGPADEHLAHSAQVAKPRPLWCRRKGLDEVKLALLVATPAQPVDHKPGNRP